jgi:hypothetical protein
MTDEASPILRVGQKFATDHTVTHSHGEHWSRIAQTRAVKSYFSIFKRLMPGV